MKKNPFLAHAMDVENSTGTRTARTSTKFVETATGRDIKCRAVKKLNKVDLKLPKLIIKNKISCKNPKQKGKNATRFGLRHLYHKHSDFEKYWETNTP